MLRGDEVGALLGDHLARSGRQGVYAASIVSSSLLGRIAADAGQPYEETLTGFKWIGRVPGLAFGYEEALGYCVAPARRGDKDGISAGLLVLELAADLKAQGLTLLDRLDEIARRHGLHATDQLSVRVSDLSLIGDAMARLRAEPPSRLGGLAVERRRRPDPPHRRAAAHRRAALLPRRRRAGRRAAVGDRAEAQVLPRGRRRRSRTASRTAWRPPASRPRVDWTRSVAIWPHLWGLRH